MPSVSSKNSSSRSAVFGAQLPDRQPGLAARRHRPGAGRRWRRAGRRRRSGAPRCRPPPAPGRARRGSDVRTTVPAPPLSSATVPCRTSRPLAMITTSSAVCSHLREQVAGDQDRLALRAEVAQEAAQPADALGVQPVGRLVEEQHPRIAEQGGGEGEPLPHAHRVGAGAAAGERRDAGELEQLVDPGVRDARRGGQDPEVVPAGAPGVEAGRLQRRADRAERVGQLVVGHAVDGGRALTWVGPGRAASAGSSSSRRRWDRGSR